MLYVIKKLDLNNMKRGEFDTGGIYYYNGMDFIAHMQTYINQNKEIVFRIVHYKDGEKIYYYVNASNGDVVNN